MNTDRQPRRWTLMIALVVVCVGSATAFAGGLGNEGRLDGEFFAALFGWFI